MPSLSKNRLGQRARLAIVAVSVIAAVAIVGYWTFRANFHGLLPHQTLRAAGVPKGTYERVINHIETGLNRYSTELGFRLRLDDVVSEGSVQTVEQITSGMVDLGIVQANVDANLSAVGAVVQLYDEVYLFFTNLPTGSSLYEIARTGRPFRVGCLGEGSQSHKDLIALLEYYGFDSSTSKVVSGDYAETAARLQRGEIEGALFVTGLQSETVAKVARTEGVRLLALDNREGYMNGATGLAPFNVPPGALGSERPLANVPTLATPAVLVASSALNTESVRRLTEVLVTQHSDLERGMRFLRIRGLDPELGVPLHAGARAFSEGTPPLWVRLDPIVRLAITVLGFLVSVLSLSINAIQYVDKRAAERKAHLAAKQGGEAGGPIHFGSETLDARRATAGQVTGTDEGSRPLS